LIIFAGREKRSERMVKGLKVCIISLYRSKILRDL